MCFKSSFSIPTPLSASNSSMLFSFRGVFRVSVPKLCLLESWIYFLLESLCHIHIDLHARLPGFFPYVQSEVFSRLHLKAEASSEI